MRTLEREDQTKHLFDEALERAPQDRAAFLADACAGDSKLLREVESLLEAYRQSEEFLPLSAIEMLAPDVAARVMSAGEDSLLAGERIGAYRILHEIGRGGMGVVFLAERDDEHYRQQVAVKLIKRGMDTDTIVRRFRRERQILADLQHPNIARLLDGGATEDGRLFLVMEYITGQPINEYANTRRLSTEDQLRLFLTASEAVAYAHQNHVIHRDLKPGNILITNDGTPKLLDFGIAKLLNLDEATGSEDVTVTALRVMTPEYASPEQLRGLAATPSSDVYSLGVLLYELLTGCRPYHFTSHLPQEVLQILSETLPPKPSAVVTDKEEPLPVNRLIKVKTSVPVKRSGNGKPGEVRRRLRGDLDNIVLMALRQEPERRYASVEQFAEDIRRHLQGLPVTARKDAFTYRGAKFLKRHKTSALTALAVALLCLLIGLSFNLFTGRPKARESIAVMPFINTNQAPNTQYISDAISETLTDYVSRIPNLSVPARGSVLRYKGQTEDLQIIGRTLGVEILVTGFVTVEGEQVSVKIELLDTNTNQVISSKRLFGKTSEILTLQQELAKEVSQKLALQIDTQTQAAALRRNTQDEEAYQLYLRGNYFWNQRTVLGLRQAIESFRAAIDKDPNYALAYVGIANSYSLLGAYNLMSPKEAFASARIAAQKAIEIDENLAEAHTSLALIKWLHDWDWAAAEGEFKRAIELNSSYATAHHWYGLYLAEMGRFEEAIRQENLAIEINPNSLYIRADLGRVYFYARQYEESLRQYRKATDMAPTHGAFFYEILPVYEQLRMYDDWFAIAEIVSWTGGKKKETFSANGITSLRRIWIRNLRSEKRSGYQYSLAENYAQVMEKDRAFEMLDRAYEARDHRMAQLKVNPHLDPLRSDPRFEKLLRRMNLSQ